jgi:Iap family predicted aminopeptidase
LPRVDTFSLCVHHKTSFIVSLGCESNMHHLEAHLDHWTRQFDQSPQHLETRVYQVTKLASSPEERDLVIAMTSKSSAQRLIAAFAEAQGPDRYRVTCFEHPTLPGMEH